MQDVRFRYVLCFGDLESACFVIQVMAPYGEDQYFGEDGPRIETRPHALGAEILAR